MSRDSRVYLEDILESIRRIKAYVAGLDENDLAEDQLRLDAVVRNLEVIGQAVKGIPDELRAQHPRVEWRKIAGLRDLLIHQYFGIDLAIIWDVLETKLPQLEKQVQTILDSLSAP